MAKKSSYELNLHKEHRERVRRRFLEVGLDGFADHEILEFLLFYARPRVNTNELSHLLLRRFDNIQNIIDAPVSELESIAGIGESSAVFFKLLGALLKENLYTSKKQNSLDTSEKINEYILPHFTNMSVESVVVVAVDAARRPIIAKALAEGNDSTASLTPAKIARFLIENKAYGAIIAHNHPSGLAVPSMADIRSTDLIKRALNSVGIKLIDHLIVVKDDFISIRDSGSNIYTTI